MPRTGPTGSTPSNPYINPFQKTKNLQIGRIDQGVDFVGGTGDVTAIGSGKVIYSGSDATVPGGTGWGPPNGPAPGGFVEYTLNKGPASGQNVYVAEGIYPEVKTGQHIRAGQKIAKLTGSPGGSIETGWGSGVGSQPLSQTPQAGRIGGKGPFPTKVGINFDELLVGLGVTPSPGMKDTGFGSLPKGMPKQYGKGSKSGGGGGGSTQKATLTSFFGDIKSAGQLFGLLSNADFWERVGLVLLGAILIIVGIIILALPAGERAIRDIAGIKRSATSIGLGGGDSGPSPEVQADKERRLSLAEANTKIGERKIAVAESKESRLALGKPAQKRHKSGNPEPNPAPTHS